MNIAYTIICMIFLIGVALGFSTHVSAEEYLIPEWIKNNAGWWASGSIGDSDFVLGVQYLINQEILVVNTSIIPNDFPLSLKENAARWANGDIDDEQFLEILKDWIEGTLPLDNDNVKHQNSNDKIRFSGFGGPMINCESFSYTISISVYTQSSDHVIIEIIDPDGNVAGRDEFQSDEHDGGHRIIEMTWGKDGKYLIQVHYKGEIYQEDFSYNEQSSEIYAGYRMSCLRETYLQPLFENIGYITIPKTPYPHLENNFYESINYVNELLRESDSKHLMSIISEENIKKIITREKEIRNLDELHDTWREIESVTSALVKQNHLKLSEEAEEELMQNTSMTVDEKIELILEFRKYNKNRELFLVNFVIERQIS